MDLLGSEAGHDCWALLFLPESPCCQSDSGSESPEIAAGCHVTTFPLAHLLPRGVVQMACVSAQTRVWGLKGLCLPHCCPGAHCLLTWLIAAWLPGSPPQCPLLGLIGCPRNGLLPTSWYEDSLSVGHISCHYKWISILQVWTPSYRFKNWQLLKPDLEPAQWLDFITCSVKGLGTL